MIGRTRLAPPVQRPAMCAVADVLPHRALRLPHSPPRKSASMPNRECIGVSRTLISINWRSWKRSRRRRPYHQAERCVSKRPWKEPNLLDSLWPQRRFQGTVSRGPAGDGPRGLLGAGQGPAPGSGRLEGRPISRNCQFKDDSWGNIMARRPAAPRCHAPSGTRSGQGNATCIGQALAIRAERTPHMSRSTSGDSIRT